MPTSRARAPMDALREQVERKRGEVARAEPLPLPKQIEQMRNAFQLAMPKGLEATQLIRDALTCLRVNPQLQACTPASVLGGLMVFAQLGLRPGVPALGHGWLVPMRDKGILKAQTIIGYKGYAELAWRTGRVKSLAAHPVHENDYFDYSLAPAHIEHKPPKLGEDRGKILGYYSYVELLDGGLGFAVMTVAEVEAHRDKYAMARKNGKVVGPWVNFFDQMACKTVFLQATNLMPRAPELVTAEAADHKAVELDADNMLQLPTDEPMDPADDAEDAEVVDEPKDVSKAVDPTTGEIKEPDAGVEGDRTPEQIRAQAEKDWGKK